MPITAQDDVTEVIELLRRPAQTALSWQDILKSLGRQYAKRNKQFQLSDKNWFLRSQPLTPNALDEPLNVDDYSVPVKVTIRNRNSAPDDNWYPVEIVNADEIERARIEGRNAVAIYGSPPNISYSMDITDQNFTLWYEPAATRPTNIADTPEIEQDFNMLLIYDTALECGGMVRDESKEFKDWWKDQRVYLLAQVRDWEAIMLKWMNMGRNQGRAYKRTWPMSNRGNYGRGDEFKRR